MKGGNYTKADVEFDKVYNTKERFRQALRKELTNMSEGHIPVNASDLPIDTPPLDESAVYDVILKKVVLNPKKSKDGTGVAFCKLQCEVIGGDFEGAFLPLNYLPLPVKRYEDLSDEVKSKGDGSEVMTKGQRYQAEKISVPFGRFTRAFKITGEIPSANLLDPDSIGQWQDWISQFYESTGKVTIRNQEFPVGSGRLSSGINDFLF